MTSIIGVSPTHLSCLYAFTSGGEKDNAEPTGVCELFWQPGEADWRRDVEANLVCYAFPAVDHSAGSDRTDCDSARPRSRHIAEGKASSANRTNGPGTANSVRHA